MAGNDGMFIWYELMTTDVEAAQAFYTKVIGWTVHHSAGQMPYTIWMAGEKGVGGVAELPEEARQMGAPPNWMGYIKTPDVDAATRKVEAKGGTVFVQPRDIPEVGRFAVVADPFRAAFAMMTPSEPDMPPDYSSPGFVSWHELATTSWQEAFAFYEDLFGWKKGETMDMGGGMTYQLFGAGGEDLGGIYDKQPDQPGPPMWLYYVKVQDLDAAVARVREHGGRVLNGPMPVPGESRVAQCMDPQGAVFALHGR